MRILHLLHQYLPEKVGGTELYTGMLARFQAADGHRVAIFTPATADDHFPEPTIEEGVRVYRAPTGPRSAADTFRSTFRHPALARAFGTVLVQEQPDLVHIQHLMGVPTGVVGQLRRAGIPWLVTLHDYWYLCANGQLITNDTQAICDGPAAWINCGRCALARAGRPELWPLAPALAPVFGWRHHQLRQILGGARAIVAPTRFVAEAYRRTGFDSTRLHHIPHGISWPDPLPPRTSPPGGPLRIISVGSLAWQKGLHTLVEAVNGLSADTVTLHLYGDPATFPDYSATLQRSARHPAIHFGGRIGRDALWQELVNADVGVLPTLWYEVSPLVIDEMFAAGLPIVASRIGAMPEKIADGTNGLLFPPGDVAALRQILATLAGDPALLARLRSGILPVNTTRSHLAAMQTVYQWIMDHG
jgi:glycosyltransferase involved in cell wall biosynthesis